MAQQISFRSLSAVSPISSSHAALRPKNALRVKSGSVSPTSDEAPLEKMVFDPSPSVQPSFPLMATASKPSGSSPDSGSSSVGKEGLAIGLPTR